LSKIKLPSIPIRHALYVAAGVVGLLVPVAVSLHLIAPSLGVTILQLASAFGALSGGVAAVAVNRQSKDGTLAFTGTASEQAIAAVKAVLSEAATANANAAKVQQVVNEAVATVSSVTAAVNEVAKALPAPAAKIADTVVADVNAVAAAVNTVTSDAAAVVPTAVAAPAPAVATPAQTNTVPVLGPLAQQALDLTAK
jgi:acyl-CoA synthetase (AMP-forming)/AMP-acid ligase II